jgi:hypothetical protein
MPIGSNTRVVLTYIEEVTRGTTPATPTLTVLRAIGRNVNLEKEILESAEVRPTRQRSDVRHGFNRVAGNPGFQLSLQDYDDQIEYAMGGTWAAVTTTGTPDMGADGTLNQFTRAAGSWITDGFRPGDIITTTGFTTTANNVTAKRCIAVAATTITMGADVTLVTEVSGPGQTLDMVGNRIDMGTTLKTMTIERQFQDLTLYQVFRGVAVNQFSLTVSPEAIANGTLDLIGMSSDAISGSSLDATPTAAQDTSPFAAFDGALWEGGAIIAVATSLDFNINNQRTLEGVIGSKFSPDVFDGTAIITGNLSVFFESAALQAKFFNETESSLWMRLDDLNGTDFMDFKFYRVKYTGHGMDPGGTGPVTQGMPFEATEQTTYGTAMSVQRSNT